LLNTITDLLKPEGSLARSWPEYEHRPGQIEMAGKVALAFEGDDMVMVEAGTGTGKTLAYLLPALLSGRKTIVSTGTKNLQEQIFHKDIPFIRRHLGSGFKAAYLKGRENYLCLKRFRSFLAEPAFILPDEAAYQDSIIGWADSTVTGDRAELADLPEDFLTWSDLTATADQCLGGECPDYRGCFLQKARRAAAAADLVVVNHHLFMADLAVREDGHGEVIPDYEAVIFDEAHQLEEVATNYFGLSVSSYNLGELRRDAERVFKKNKKMIPALNRALIYLKNQTDALVRNFIKTEGECELWPDSDPVLDRLREYGTEVAAGLDALAARFEAEAGADEEVPALVRRARQISHDLTFILEARDSGYVYYAEQRKAGIFLKAAPIDVGPILQERLFNQGLILVFTSATLTADRSFDYFRERLGLLPEIEGFIFDSPFDFTRQSLLYVPKNLPPPQSAKFLELLVDEIEGLLRASRGRAFVLFTSYRNLDYVAENLPRKADWPFLVQGQAPRGVLLDRFRAEQNSVLLATQSFWQGVDVPGESLSAVIIDKLPFAPPERPLIKARLERLRQEGIDPFIKYQVPEAVITLKQGLGRLIRAKTDRGLLAVMDTRLVNKGYGRIFRQSLPDSPFTRDRAEVEKFFRE